MKIDHLIKKYLNNKRKMLSCIEFVRLIYLAIISRYKVFYYRKIHKVQFGKNVRINTKLLIHGFGKIIIGDECRFSSRRSITELCTTNKNAEIHIGNNCLINGAVIGAAKSIIIGDNCILAEAYIRDTSSHGISPDERHNKLSAKIEPVLLGNNVWIGSQTHIMPGITIGENTIIGANSVVTKSIPKNVFAAGNPAKIIKEL